MLRGLQVVRWSPVCAYRLSILLPGKVGAQKHFEILKYSSKYCLPSDNSCRRTVSNKPLPQLLCRVDCTNFRQISKYVQHSFAVVVKYCSLLTLFFRVRGNCQAGLEKPKTASKLWVKCVCILYVSNNGRSAEKGASLKRSRKNTYNKRPSFSNSR